MKTYLVIVSSEDGPSMCYITKDKLIERLNENYWGNDIKWFSNPELFDLELMCNQGIIMEGKPIVPKPKKVIETYEL